MAETKIEWADYTFNPWRGCAKVSPGCAHCYAETWSHRNPALLGEWGPGGQRVIAAESYWRQPLKWDRAARKAGERRRVFCASLADVFEDRPELDAPLARLLATIDDTQALDWLLLTKRPELFRKRLRAAIGQMPRRGTRGPFTGPRWNAVDWLQGGEPSGRGYPPNVWLGVSVEDQQRAGERIPRLLEIPAAVRFLSCEPLLEPLDLTKWLAPAALPLPEPPGDPLLDWVIVGGESGRKARRCNLAWIRSIRDQCQDAGVACFIKQLGYVWHSDDPIDLLHPWPGRGDPKGGDPSEWPEDLRVRQFPEDVP